MGRGEKDGIARFTALALLLAANVPLLSQTPGYHANGVTNTGSKCFDVEITDIDTANRDKVTRISFNLIGVPHTSQRIDEVELVNGKARIAADDIDGVDFKRYFQWEDEGIIPVDIDFPTLRSLSRQDSVVFHTATGVYGWKIGEKTSRK